MSNKIVNRVDGIEMILHEYCDFCPDFEVEVDKTDITSASDPAKRTQTWIRCGNSEKCARLKERLEKEISHAGTKRL